MQSVNVHQRGVAALGVLLSFVGYGCFARFVERTDFTSVFGLYALLFAAFYGIYKSGFTFRQLVVLSVLFRLLFIVSIPALSNDYYRFVWDGRMLAAGFNPYLYIPQEFLQTNPNAITHGAALVSGMGNLSATHFTVYPPLNQLCYWVAGWLFPNDVASAIATMRVIILAADLAVIYVGVKVLNLLGKAPRKIFLYVLNPFVILEFTGNLHWEGVMALLLLVGVYFVLTKKWFNGALFWGLSVSIKLIPLLFLPLLFSKLGFKKTILFGAVTVGVLALLFAPFLSATLLANFGSSIELYFQSFEFNASVYYVFREIGYIINGFNNIALIGKILPVLVLIYVVVLSVISRKGNQNELPKWMLFAICGYYVLSTTVHPWYLGVPLLLSVFTRYRFMQVWTFVIITTYWAYAFPEWQEQLWVVALEYISVMLFFLAEHFNWFGLADKNLLKWQKTE